MSKSHLIILALLSCSLLSSSPALAQSSDRALLATFCEAGNIHGKTCTRAKDYPDAPKRGCDVTLTGDHYRGRFVASGHPLLVVLYESGCEAHATDNGGSVVFEQAGGHWSSKALSRACRPVAASRSQRTIGRICWSASTAIWARASWKPAWR